MRENLTI